MAMLAVLEAEILADERVLFARVSADGEIAAAAAVAGGGAGGFGDCQHCVPFGGSGFTTENTEKCLREKEKAARGAAFLDFQSISSVYQVERISPPTLLEWKACGMNNNTKVRG